MREQGGLGRGAQPSAHCKGRPKVSESADKSLRDNYISFDSLFGCLMIIDNLHDNLGQATSISAQALLPIAVCGSNATYEVRAMIFSWCDHAELRILV